ncbi:MAG: heat-inducible transcription repressor HrcA [Proteobacteria bacterium]|nr:heat-inducible transcription repressor HrcA [Pseudomonadota bacterium]
MELTERSAQVLREIVDMYTRTGQPVGSKSLAETLPMSLSPASIRNVMAELEAQGLLMSPHTSAGRIPTEQGFRFYARGLVEVGELNGRLKAELEQRIARAPTFDAAMQEVSRTLAHLSSCAGLVLAPRYDDARLQQMEFIRLGPDKALAVLVADNGKLENRMIAVPPSLSDSELRAAADDLNRVVRGKTLAEAREHVVAALRQQKLALDSLMDKFLMAPDATDTALMVGGSQNLFGYPELVRERLQSLFEVFEEKRLLIGLLDRVRQSDGIQVFIGAECPLEAARDCAMITATYGTADKKVVGTLGVIGPMRMNYRQSIALVDYTARLLGRVLDERLS